MFSDDTVKELMKALVEAERDGAKLTEENHPLVCAQKILMRQTVNELLSDNKELIIQRTEAKMEDLKRKIKEEQN